VIVIDIDIVKRMRTQEGVADLSVRMHLADGALVTLGGRSGSGKTTLLRVLAGLARPDRGKIVADGRVWCDAEKKLYLRTQARSLGFVFQEDALFPHLTVRENVLFARRCERTARDLLVFLEIDHLGSRFPHQLSGGQRQRAAIARALARGPGLLLLDEPFSHVDREMKGKLCDEIRRINTQLRVMVVLVTHNMEEIRRLGGRQLTLEQGRLTADRSAGNPEDGACPWELRSVLRPSGSIKEVLTCRN
jgi:molybdate transport system ATP-binding protein